MDYSTRIKRKKNGDTQIRITIDVTAEEIDGVNKIADDKYCTIDTIKQYDPELSLAYARTFCFWATLWSEGNKEKLVDFALKRKQAEAVWHGRANKRKKRATRSRKK